VGHSSAKKNSYFGVTPKGDGGCKADGNHRLRTKEMPHLGGDSSKGPGRSSKQFRWTLKLESRPGKKKKPRSLEEGEKESYESAVGRSPMRF